MTLTSKIAAASVKVGGSLSPDKTNTEQRYDYLSADKILAIGGQALAEQGVVIYPEITTWHVDTVAYTSSRGTQGTRYDAMIAFTMKVTDGEDREEMPWLGLGSDYAVPDKAVYKAITSGHRYFIAKLLNVGAGNEDGEHEGDDTRGEGKTETKLSERKAPPTTGPAPKCPKCAGPMWDNRTSKTKPTQPDYKCKNKECDGVIWPPKDTPAERQEAAGNLFDDALPTVDSAPATAAQVQRMGILAQKIYGKEELESVFRPWLRESYGVDSRKGLTTAQAQDVIVKLEAAERSLDAAAGK